MSDPVSRERIEELRQAAYGRCAAAINCPLNSSVIQQAYNAIDALAFAAIEALNRAEATEGGGE